MSKSKISSLSSRSRSRSRSRSHPKALVRDSLEHIGVDPIFKTGMAFGVLAFAILVRYIIMSSSASLAAQELVSVPFLKVLGY